MNTLSDTLNDLICKVLDTEGVDTNNCLTSELLNDEQIKQDLIERYMYRIKNELNVEKYLK
jgi:hypothetical protein